MTKAIDLFVSRIRQKYGEKIHNVILFGSYVRSEAKPDSDVDLLVVTSDGSFLLEYDLIGMGYDLFLEMGILLSVKVVSKEHYQARQDYLFFKEVNRDGVVVA